MRRQIAALLKAPDWQDSRAERQRLTFIKCCKCCKIFLGQTLYESVLTLLLFGVRRQDVPCPRRGLYPGTTCLCLPSHIPPAQGFPMPGIHSPGISCRVSLQNPSHGAGHLGKAGRAEAGEGQASSLGCRAGGRAPGSAPTAHHRPGACTGWQGCPVPLQAKAHPAPRHAPPRRA